MQFTNYTVFMNKLNLTTLILLLCLCPLTHADEVIKTFPAGGAEDVLNKPGNDVTGAIQINAECMGIDKKVYKKGQDGYEDCLKQRLNRTNKAKPNGGRGSPLSVNPPLPLPVSKQTVNYVEKPLNRLYGLR